jgi:hypothetical protein
MDSWESAEKCTDRLAAKRASEILAVSPTLRRQALY